MDWLELATDIKHEMNKKKIKKGNGSFVGIHLKFGLKARVFEN